MLLSLSVSYVLSIVLTGKCVRVCVCVRACVRACCVSGVPITEHKYFVIMQLLLIIFIVHLSIDSSELKPKIIFRQSACISETIKLLTGNVVSFY